MKNQLAVATRSYGLPTRLRGWSCAVMVMLLAGAHAVGADKPTTADLFQNPFSKDSAHHRPIGTGAVYAATDDPATVDWLKANGSAVNSSNGWGSRVAEIKPDDPAVTVESARPRAGNGLPVTMKIPVGFSGGTTSDAAADVYDPDTGTLHEFYLLHLTDGRYTAAHRREIPVRGLGHTPPGKTDRVGVTASGISIFLGLLRGHEVNTPGCKIQHALNFTLPRRPDHRCAMMLSKEIVWPASSRDGSALNPPENLGHIPYGALLAIPTVAKGGPDLDTLGLSEPGRRVAEALRDYGAYVTDGSQCPAMRGDQFITEPVRLQIRDDLRKVYKFIRQVRNNAPGQSASGGGTPLAPNAAFDAP